jgi:hypothetical protein
VLGYVLTATDTVSGCAWQSPGAASATIGAIKDANYCADTGSANAITCNTTTTFTSYVTGQLLVVKMAATNTTAVTLAANSIAGAKAITKAGSTALAAGNLIIGQEYAMVYDGTRFQVLNPTLLAADVPTLNQTTSGTAAGITGIAIATAATASTLAERNASGELIAANTVPTGKTPMATDTPVTSSQLPFPGASAKGAILTTTCTGGQVADGYQADGTPHCVAAGSSSSITYTTYAAAPVERWTMTDGTGSTFVSACATAGVCSTTHSNSITATGVVWAPEPLVTGLAAYFSGAFNSTAANYTAFNPTSTTAFSVSFWTSIDESSTGEILASQRSTGTNNPGWTIVRDDAKRIIVSLADSAGGSINKTFTPILYGAASPGYAAGVGGLSTPLYHLLLAVDGTHTAAGVLLYIDGVLATTYATGSDTLTGAMTPSAAVQIGSTTPSINYFANHVGFISGLTIWASALAQADVSAVYANGPAWGGTYTYPTLTSQRVDASTIPGVVLDGTVTDNAPALNLILNTATADKPVDLVFLKSSLISGLHIPKGGHVTIEGIGPDVTLTVKAGSNASAISNGYGQYPTGTVPPRGANVTIKNLTINANRGTYPNGNSNRTDARGNPWITAVDIVGIDGVTMENLTILNSPTYNVSMSNVGRVSAINSRFVGLGTNTDGFHVGCPANDLFFLGTKGGVGDDLFALNGPETYGTGSLSNVVIRDSTLTDYYGGNLLRAYQYLSSPTHNCGVNGLIVDGVPAGHAAFPIRLIGDGVPPAPPTVDLGNSARFSNITLTGGSQGFLTMDRAWGEASLNHVTWRSPEGAYPLVNIVDNSLVSSLSITSSKIIRTTDGSSAAYGLKVNSGATLKRADLSGLSIEDQQGQSYNAVPYLTDVVATGSIGTYLPSFDPSHITSQLSTGSAARITTVVYPTTSANSRVAMITDMAPVAGDSGLILVLNSPSAVHLTRVFCAVQGTTNVVVNLDKRAEGTIGTDSGAHLLGSDLTAVAGGANTATFANGSSQCGGTASCAIAANVPVVMTFTSVSGTPTALNCGVDYTVD